MNNKKLGSAFEREYCQILADKGYWVHFMSPDNRGAQPFDIIAVKDGIAYAFDCKTCVANSFGLDRLEENQKMAFEKWLKSGNTMPVIVVKHNGGIYEIPYNVLVEEKKIKL